MQKTNLTGHRFGRLTVLSEHPAPYISPSGKPTRRWICRCDCGRETIVLHNQLTAGKTKSCGCLQRDKAMAQGADLTGQHFGRLLVLQRTTLPRKLANGAVTGWLCRCDCGNEIIKSTGALTHGGSRSCGCLLSDTGHAKMQKIAATNATGRFNGTVISAIRPKRKINSNNKTGVNGVYWSNRENRWIAKIGVQGKSITLGRFADFDKAVAARRAGEEKYFRPLLAAYANKPRGSEQ